MTTTNDPWNVCDLDPTSTTAAQGVPLNTAATLEFARVDFHDAIAAVDDLQRSRQYAISARDCAVTVIAAGDVTADELRLANTYLAGAEALIANT